MGISTYIQRRIAETKAKKSMPMDERLRRAEEEKKRLELKKRVIDEESKIKQLQRDYEPTTLQRLQKAAAKVQARTAPKASTKLKKNVKKQAEKKEGFGRGFGSSINPAFGGSNDSPFKK